MILRNFDKHAKPPDYGEGYGQVNHTRNRSFDFFWQELVRES